MDMLVKLYELPSLEAEEKKMREQGITISRAFPANRFQLVKWVEEHTSVLAAGEADCCFCSPCPTMFIARRGEEVLGYACYNATAPDFFGPTEVLESERGKGIGRALLIYSLHALKAEGYAYAIIGSIGPEEFYRKSVGAVCIEGSTPGIYSNMLKAVIGPAN